MKLKKKELLEFIGEHSNYPLEIYVLDDLDREDSFLREMFRKQDMNLELTRIKISSREKKEKSLKDILKTFSPINEAINKYIAEKVRDLLNKRKQVRREIHKIIRNRLREYPTSFRKDFAKVLEKYKIIMTVQFVKYIIETGDVGLAAEKYFNFHFRKTMEFHL